jgi:hypothetical protein
MKYYIGTEEQINTALATIDANCNFPSVGADRWDIAKPTANEGEFYCEAPVNGYNGFTGAEMMVGVVLTPVDSVELPIVEEIE